MNYLLLLFLVLAQPPLSSADHSRKTASVKGGHLLLQEPQQQSSISLDFKKDLKGTQLKGEPRLFLDKDIDLVFLNYADFEAATTVVYAVDKKGRKLWSMNLGSFNPSVPLIEKNVVYLGTHAKVWKVHKRTGKIYWQHKDLYLDNPYEFDGTEPIQRQNRIIQFSAKLKIDDRTGRLIEVPK